MRILITGASGLLGVNLALEAAQQLPKGSVAGVVKDHALQTGAFEVFRADLLEEGALEGLLDRIQPDWVFHCAALAVVDACEADPDLAYRLNTALPEKLAGLVARGGARLFHFSTDAVFDGQRGDYTETDQPNPLSEYARSKLAGEQAVAAANPDAIIARVNLYGWSLSGKRSLGEFFYYNLLAGKAVMGFTDVFFCPLQATHLAQICLQMARGDLPGGLYHVVASECLNKHEFGVALARRFGFDERMIRPTTVDQAGLKAARSPNLTLRVDKLAHLLGETPPGFTAGMDLFVEQQRAGYAVMVKGMGNVRDTG